MDQLLNRLWRRGRCGALSCSVTAPSSSTASTRSGLARCLLEFRSIHTQRPRNAPVMMITAMVAGSMLPPRSDSIIWTVHLKRLLRCRLTAVSGWRTAPTIWDQSNSRSCGRYARRSEEAEPGCGRTHSEYCRVLGCPRRGRWRVQVSLRTCRARGAGAA